MVIFVAAFLVGVVGMLALPLRHLHEIRVSTEVEGMAPEQLPQNAVVRSYVIGYLDSLDRWYRVSAKEFFFKLIDRVLKSFERFAGKMAGQTKEMRMMVQERFRVIPRESSYWKQMHTWKKVSNVSRSRILGDTDPHGKDISNHAL
ncbi:MAG: hypothetical protein EXS68_02500 [Candidatus Ryanbacteria bacterium]|nr:hypothetical protein [Candidatus Ryanbacteria bacterium]